jgi:hypothetical protein
MTTRKIGHDYDIFNELWKKIGNYSALQIKAIDNESTFDSFL